MSSSRRHRTKDDDTDQPKKKRKAAVLTWMRASAALRPTRKPQPPIALAACDARLATCVSEGLGVQTLFPVQRAVWLAMLAGGRPRHDVCVCAPTGSGKTLAYLLPTVNACAAARTRFVRRCLLLVVVPTRELAAQVHDVARPLCASVELDLANLAGDEAAAGVRACAEVVVSTPGRLAAAITAPSGKDMLKHLRFLVIDEVDRLLRQSYQGWLQLVLAQIHGDDEARHGILERRAVRDAAPRCIKLVLSATLTRDPIKVARLRLTDPVYIEDDIADGVDARAAVQGVDGRATTPSNDLSAADDDDSGDGGGRDDDGRGNRDWGNDANEEDNAKAEEEEEGEEDDEVGHRLPPGLKQYKLVARTGEKPLALLTLLAMVNSSDDASAVKKRETISPPSVIVFTGSLEASHRLAALLSTMHASTGDALLSSSGFSTVQFSSSMTHAQRASALDGFRNGEYRIMIASDAATRGIDIPDVDIVVNYDAPVFARTYIHRIGRTARMGKAGMAVTIMMKHEVRHFKSLVRKNASSSLIDYTLDAGVTDSIRPHFDSALAIVEGSSGIVHAAPRRRRKHDDALSILIAQARRHTHDALL